MNKESMSATLSELWGLIAYTKESPVDFRHSEKLADLVRRLGSDLDGDARFNRHLDPLLQSLRTCGLLDQIPKKPKGASGLLDEIQALQRRLL